MIKKLIAGVFALSLAFGAQAAKTVYVEKTGNDTTGDGTESKPYLTIQKGVDNAEAGDTVQVGEGDFNDVGRTMTISSVSIPTVVAIDKAITLKGAGRGKSFITGAYGDGTAQDGSDKTWADTGKGAHRCIYVNANGVRIRNFTIRNGATVRAGTGVNNDVDLGGGVVAGSGTTFLYDCDVLDCRAGEGAATSRDVRACRCRFAGNKSKGNSQVMYRNSYTYNCLFENNGTGNSGSCIFTYVQSYAAVNCTFLNNNCSRIFHSNSASGLLAKGYNCLVIGTSTMDGGAVTTYYDMKNVVQDSTAASSGAIQKYAANNCVWDVNRTLQYFSPAAEDWSSVEGNSIVGKGDASLLTAAITGFSADDLTTDYLGNPRKTDDSVSVGCFEPTAVKPVQSSVCCLAGGVRVTDGTTTLEGPAGFWGALSANRQVRVGYAGEGEVFGYTVENTGGVLGGVNYSTSRFPDNNGDGGFWLTPTKGGTMTITAIPAAGVMWADANYAGDDSDGSEEKPYKTIPEAIAAVAANGIVKVKPGTYATGTDVGSTHDAGGDSAICRVSLWKNVAVRSVEGAEKTVIKGGADVGVIVAPSRRTRYAQLQGFTLTNGTQDPSRYPDPPVTNMAFCAAVSSGESARDHSETVHLTDCVISNVLSSSRAVAGGWLERCLLVDNFTTVANMNKGTSGSRGTQSFGSILTGCVSYYTPTYFNNGYRPTACTCAHQNCTELNCTFYIPGLDAKGLNYRTVNVPNGSTVCINNAMVNPTYDSYVPSAFLYAGGNLSSPGSNSGWIKSIATGTFFVDSAQRDFRPIAGSAGLQYSEVTTNLYVRYETGDFNGRPLAYETNGKPIPGAFQEPVRALTVTSSGGRGTVEPSGSFLLADGAAMDFTVTSSTHRFLGWEVDGETVLTDSKTYHYVVDASKASLTLEPLFDTNLYVNATSGNDETGDGQTPETAKKTLAAIAAIAVAGDTIHAAPGTYDEGYSDCKTGYTGFVSTETVARFSNARVLLKQGVSLVSDGGAAVTTIKGYAAPAGSGDSGYANTGCGPDSLRCVAAYANTYLKGFTLTGGYTRGLTGGPTDANGGGCVIAKPYNTSRADTLLVEDCIIQDGHARSGCCVYGGFYNRCVIKNGTSFSSSGPGCAHTARLANCVVWQDNDTRSSVTSVRGIYNSLVYAKNATSDGDLTGSSATYPIVNSVLVTEGNSVTDCVLKYVKNCFVRLLSIRAKLDEATCKDNTIVTNYNDFDFNAASPPTGLLATSPLIDKGDSSLFDPDTSSGLDVNGNQRIFNAKVDVGPFEFDWRPVYAADLKAEGITVTEASPEVVETPTKNVKLADGATLALTWPGEGEDHVVRYVLEGEGTLTMTDENGAATPITASGSTVISGTTEDSALTFAYAGTGSATLTTFGLNKAAVSVTSVNGAVEPSGEFMVDIGSPLTVSATSVRGVVSFEVTTNGCTFALEPGERSYTWTPQSFDDTLSVNVVYDTNWYVDPTKSDDNDGFTPETAKKTLAVIGAMAISGDTIHAAAGDYNEGTTNQPSQILVNNTKSPSRIVLAPGVTLVADEGPDKTIINGVPTKGPEGVRCVACYAGSVVRGFTLRNGATSDTTGGEQDLNMGGCVLAPKATSRAATALIDNCIISGGKARTGGCVAGGYLHRCTIRNGSSGAGASLTSYSLLDHSIAIGNGNTGVREHMGIYSSLIVNPNSGTVYPDNKGANSSVKVENSIVMGMNREGSMEGRGEQILYNVKNSIWNVGGDVLKIDDATSCNVITCRVTTATAAALLAAVGLGSDYRPLAGSLAIDKGDNAFLADVLDGTTDLDGLQRIWNGLVDIGPYEYAQTNEFSAAICGKGAKVSGASEMTELKDAAIDIPAGEQLFITWKGIDAGETAKLTVSTGNLKVYRGDACILEVNAAGTYTIESVAATTELKFVAEDGKATITSFKPDRPGLILIFR